MSRMRISHLINFNFFVECIIEEGNPRMHTKHSPNLRNLQVLSITTRIAAGTIILIYELSFGFFLVGAKRAVD